jgi:hypothetical protein
MSVLLAIASAILWTILALVLLVVLVPFRARAAGAVHDGEPAGEIGADWGFGLLGFALDTERRVTLRLAWIPMRFRVGAKRGRSRERRGRGRGAGQEAKVGRAKPGKGRVGPAARLRAALGERDAFQRMAARLARALHLRLRAAGRIGIGDPAETAALFAVLQAAERLPGVELALELEWVEEALEVELTAGARIWVAELLGVALGLWLEPPNRRAIRAALGWT